MSTPVSSSKLVLRRDARARRDAMPADDRAAASARICVHATAALLARVPAGAVVALYAAKASEVDLAALDAALRAAGRRVAYPRVVADARPLGFAEATLDDLVAAPLGLREPAATAALLSAAELAAIVVPGVAFDRAGHRLGYGRGHYDATLAASRSAYAIGVAFDCQIVAPLDAEPHDVAVRAVITESGAVAI